METNYFSKKNNKMLYLQNHNISKIIKNNLIKKKTKLYSLKKRPIFLSSSSSYIDNGNTFITLNHKIKAIKNYSVNSPRFKDKKLKYFLLIKKSVPIIKINKSNNQYIDTTYKKLFVPVNTKQKIFTKNFTPFEKLNKKVKMYKKYIETNKMIKSESFINKKINRDASCYKLKRKNSCHFERINIIDNKIKRNNKVNKDFKINCYYNKINLTKFSSILKKIKKNDL